MLAPIEPAPQAQQPPIEHPLWHQATFLESLASEQEVMLHQHSVESDALRGGLRERALQLQTIAAHATPSALDDAARIGIIQAMEAKQAAFLESNKIGLAFQGSAGTGLVALQPLPLRRTSDGRQKLPCLGGVLMHEHAWGSDRDSPFKISEKLKAKSLSASLVGPVALVNASCTTAPTSSSPRATSHKRV